MEVLLFQIAWLFRSIATATPVRWDPVNAARNMQRIFLGRLRRKEIARTVRIAEEKSPV
jgi:hypothetical protein